LAEHGDADAEFALASLYYNGIGVPLDRTESNHVLPA
jgi:TPR repeat protein